MDLLLILHREAAIAAASAGPSTPLAAATAESEWSVAPCSRRSARRRKAAAESGEDAFSTALIGAAERFAFDLTMVARGVRGGFLVDYCGCAALDGLMRDRATAVARLDRLVRVLRSELRPPLTRLCAVVIDRRHLFFVDAAALERQGVDVEMVGMTTRSSVRAAAPAEGGAASQRCLLAPDAPARSALHAVIGALLQALRTQPDGIDEAALLVDDEAEDTASGAPVARLLRFSSSVALAGWLLGYPLVYDVPTAEGESESEGTVVRTLSSLSCVTLWLFSFEAAAVGAGECERGGGGGGGTTASASASWREVFSFSVPESALPNAAPLLRRLAADSAAVSAASRGVAGSGDAPDALDALGALAELEGGEGVSAGEQRALRRILALVLRARALEEEDAKLKLRTTKHTRPRWSRFRVVVSSVHRAGVAM